MTWMEHAKNQKVMFFHNDKSPNFNHNATATADTWLYLSSLGNALNTKTIKNHAKNRIERENVHAS